MFTTTLLLHYYLKIKKKEKIAHSNLNQSDRKYLVDYLLAFLSTFFLVRYFCVQIFGIDCKNYVIILYFILSLILLCINQITSSYSSDLRFFSSHVLLVVVLYAILNAYTIHTRVMCSFSLFKWIPLKHFYLVKSKTKTK